MIKKGNQVEVICGKDKGKKGEVIEILSAEYKAKVKGINIIKKHEKTTKEKKGGIISKESFIHISNLKSLSEFIPYSIAAIFIIGFFVINSNQNIDNNNSTIEDSALLYSLISGEEITEESVFDYLVTNTSSNNIIYKK